MIMVLAATLHAFITVHTTANDLIQEWNNIFIVYTETQQLLYGLNVSSVFRYLQNNTLTLKNLLHRISLVT